MPTGQPVCVASGHESRGSGDDRRRPTGLRS
jgi:hypothetical protein